LLADLNTLELAESLRSFVYLAQVTGDSLGEGGEEETALKGATLSSLARGVGAALDRVFIA